jgi:sterol desaturase/sphingolipid hydroxylase (fatty acid hydroxylase superfamily)
MHHSDPAVDVTTAARFHFGELILSSVIRLVLIPLFGIPLDAIILYDVIQLPVIAFHHANIALQPTVDKILRLVIVTPFMHKVHHSRERNETDSNYSSILSIWDRVFGSYVEREEYTSIGFGLAGYDSEYLQSLPGLLRTPLLPADEVTRR